MCIDTYVYIHTRPIVSADACIAVGVSCAGLGMQEEESRDTTETRQICQKRHTKEAYIDSKRWIYMNPTSRATEVKYAWYVKKDVKDALKGKRTYKRGLHQSNESCDATEVRQICQNRRSERKTDIQKRPISIKKYGSIAIQRVVRRD